jgi:2-ketocyclohexanecarboxyl-CoA hydrolase
MSGVSSEKTDGLVWIRFERPERRNAYDREMAAAVTAAVDEASTEDVLAVVITGSGGSFCAGGALDNLSDPSADALRALFLGSLRMFDAIRACPRPVIAAVNGAAAGGGNELVVACDLAIAARSATFGQTGPRVGSAPVFGATNLMALQLGEKHAKEWSFLCRRYSAEHAERLGLVNEVVDDDRLEDRVREIGEEIRRLSPRYLEIAKQSSNVWWNQLRDSYMSGFSMLIQAVGSPDMIEGATAFLEKRRPQFRPSS